MQGGPLTVPCVQLKGQPVHNGGCAYVGRPTKRGIGRLAFQVSGGPGA
jgi:hypothetical protein